MAVVCLCGALRSVLHLGTVHPPLHHVLLPSSSKKRTRMTTTTATTSTIPPSPILEQFKQDFYARYGGHDAAMTMYHQTVHALGSRTATAHRLLRAAATHQPFVMAFAGYSVTVGRGNYFNQSFPFVLERLLQTPLETILPTTRLVVRNAAIGGIPSFPYAFCLPHFLGIDADVISWDYSMNEGQHGASVLEAYLRQGLSQLPKRPMLIMLDGNEERIQLLSQYTNELHILPDAIVVNAKQGLLDAKQFLQLPDEAASRPVGYQHWNDFGAPDKCPGRNGWHPKKMEHELYGWIMAMHFVQVLEDVHTMIQNDPTHLWKQRFAADSSMEAAPLAFPPVLVPPPKNNDPSVTELLYGHPPQLAGSSTTTSSQHQQQHQRLVLKDISCRTSFLPALDHDTTLPSVVVSGMAPTDLPIMQARPDSVYQQGWVLDVSKMERDTKSKVEQCGGLGYVDMKIALYGIPDSGPLRLWLPYESQRYHEHHREHGHDNKKNDDDVMAKHWFDDLIICEANEKRPEKACQLDQDLEYTVGGVMIQKVTKLDGAGVYLKRPTCVHIGVPTHAKITRLGELTKKNDGAVLTSEQRRQLVIKQQGTGNNNNQKKKQASDNNNNDKQVGLVVDITIKPRVTRKDGACCLSHIVWEQH